MPTALPGSPSLSWQYNLNFSATSGTTIDRHRIVAKQIVDALTGFASNPWTCIGSSNSVAHGMDGTNRWVSISNIVFGDPGSSMSWIVLRNPSLGNFQILFACDITDTTGRIMSAYFSVNSGFTGGSTTSRPTATDEVSWNGQSYWLDGVDSGRSMKVHVHHATNGTNTRILVYFSGYCILYAAIDKLVSVRAGVTYPVVATWCSGVDSERLTATVYCLSYGTYGSFYMRAAPVGFPVYIFPLLPWAAASAEPVVQTAANAYSGDWPVWEILVEDNNNRSHIGKIPDMYIGSATKISGEGYPAIDKVWMHYTDIILPYNNTVIQYS